jgi:peptide/nickel transport system substrate-binding protein
MDRLTADDWTLDPAIFAFQMTYRPSQYEAGVLAESWEFPDPSTYVVHLRHYIYWQNIPPANGRQFTADDVVYDYDRLYGLGDGFTKPDPYAVVSRFQDMKSVTATDNYTVAFKWATANPENIMETMQSNTVSTQCLENPDAVKLWGDLSDWHHAIGTGPFILQDFVDTSSATLVMNPNYWGTDERYPKNRLPYIDTLKILIITGAPTALAAVRSGKIDIIDGVSFRQAQDMIKTNPEITQITYPSPSTHTIDPRNDVKPFNDIRVREAMQMAIDLPTLAKTYYSGSCSSDASSLTANSMTGWGFPYDQWPQDLKDQYAYNTTTAKQLLAAAGYPNGFKTDIVVDNSGDMDLLQIVQSYFAAININMSIQMLDPASFSSYVITAQKHDQLAQRASIGGLGITYEPITQLKRFQTGYSATNWLMVSDPTFDAFYPKAMAATSVDGVKQVVRDANEYVARQHFDISLLQENYFGLSQPWLKGYNAQMDSISASAGPTLLFFYDARFWIDQSLKK